LIWRVTGYLRKETRRLTVVELELLSLPEYLSFSLWSLVFCVKFCGSLFVLWSLFLLAIVLSVLLWLTASDYTFGIFRLFLISSPVLLIGYVLGNDHLTWRAGGMVFSKKIFWFPMLLKKIFWFWWRKKKIIWFRVFVI
jgi:hypothetical protein